MRDFTKIAPNLWRSGYFKGLHSDDERYLYIYFMTCPHQDSTGCYHLPDAYACDDMGWPLTKYVAVRDKLIEAGMIDYDPGTNFIKISDWFAFNPPMNSKHLTGTLRVARKIPCPAFQESVVQAIWERWDRSEAQRKGDAAELNMLPVRTVNTPDQHKKPLGKLLSTGFMLKER